MKNYKIAKRNIALSKSNVYLSNLAISDTELKGVNNRNMFSSAKGNGKEFIPMYISLDTIVQRTEDVYRFDIDILKIDVEGYEMNVLYSAMNTIRKYKPKIIIETHTMVFFKQVRLILSLLGYDLLYTDYQGFNKKIGFDYVANNFYLPIV